MTFTYYDHITGSNRVKPRYKWAAWAFVIGMACGAAAHVIL